MWLVCLPISAVIVPTCELYLIFLLYFVVCAQVNLKDYSMKSIVVFSILVVSCFAQRPPFAGKRPIGYPELETTPRDELGNRFGGDDATTIKLPIEALGDVDLVNRLSKLPIDQQPFWLLNWKALEANRNNPQTYPQRGNSFVGNTVTKTR